MLPHHFEGFKCNRFQYLTVMAYQGHIVVPTTHSEAERVINEMEAKFVVSFGGYSRYDGSGGWGGPGGVEREAHARLVVNSDNMDREEFKECLTIEAEYVKAELDEEAVLIEIHEIEMDLV
jgi:hypothetical protein